MNGKKRKPNKIYLAVYIAVPLLVIAGLFFAIYEEKDIENGLLDVCAEQQDTYVDLVIKQINLKENRSASDIVTKILGTLDSSSSRYWTFSSGDTMLYVKDVMETNRYKGFVSSSYYESESANNFFSKLKENFVSHDIIEIDGNTYLASGSSFTYRGTNYKLCLLTNKELVLDNNAFLGARTRLWILILTTLFALLLISILLAVYAQKKDSKIKAEEESAENLNARLELMNERLSRQNIYNGVENIWNISALPLFIAKLDEKRTKRGALVRIRCKDDAARKQELSILNLTMDEKVLRFQAEKTDIIFLFVNYSREQIMRSITPLLVNETTAVAAAEIGSDGIADFEDAARIVAKEVFAH